MMMMMMMTMTMNGYRYSIGYLLTLSTTLPVLLFVLCI